MAAEEKSSFFDKRLIIGLLLTIGVAMSFWTGSRYPDLNEKASIFDRLLSIMPVDFH